jgi:hypothetical protein
LHHEAPESQASRINFGSPDWLDLKPLQRS